MGVRARSLVVVLLAGCAQATVPLDQLNARIAEADCVRDVRCGGYDTVAHCLAFPHTHGPVTPSIAAAVANGSVDYDPVQPAECAEQHATLSCNPADPGVRTWPSVTCRGVLGSYRKEDDPCELDQQCASYNCQPGRFCRPDECCQGSCQLPRYQSGV